MNLTTLTLDERERLAYAEGYTEAAALLAEMAELQSINNSLENEKDRAAELETERDNLQDDFEALAASLQDVVSERNEATEHAKTYRAALMALEAEVSPAMREFIREVIQ